MDYPPYSVKTAKSRAWLPWLVTGLCLFLIVGSCSLMTYMSVDRAFSFFEGGGSSGARKKPVTFGGDKIAQLEVGGVIMGGREDLFDALGEIEELVEDKSVKGLILHINSPGGAVAPTQDLYRRVLELRKSIPVVCSLGDVAASGGYYLAAACEEIYALPGTTTGSIGVIFQLFNLENLVSWAKMKPITMKAGKLKDVGSPFREMTAQEATYLQALLDSVHQQFIRDIRSQREKKIAPDVLTENADGRIFTGEQALAMGFIDKIGGPKDALAFLKNDKKLGDLDVLQYPKPQRNLDMFFKMESATFDQKLMTWGLEQIKAYNGLVPMLLPPTYLGSSR